jgi:putative transcriptional regulator
MSKTARRAPKKKLKHDWSRVDAMTDEQRHAAAMADPDARPMTDAEWARARRVPQVSIIRRAFRLSQEEFAAQFHIPIGTLRDWEQGRKEPDAAAKAYLRVIASEPETVRKALLPRPRPVVMKRKREARDVARR